MPELVNDLIIGLLAFSLFPLQFVSLLLHYPSSSNSFCHLISLCNAFSVLCLTWCSEPSRAWLCELVVLTLTPHQCGPYTLAIAIPEMPFLSSGILPAFPMSSEFKELRMGHSSNVSSAVSFGIKFLFAKFKFQCAKLMFFFSFLSS